jgi:hypothetical protein
MKCSFRLARLVAIVFVVVFFNKYICVDTTYAEPDKSAKGSMCIIGYNDETRQILELTDGFLLPWRFSYSVPSDFHNLKMFCERFVGLHKLDDTLLIDYDFPEPSVNEPYQGEILISGIHRYVSQRTLYRKNIDCVDQNGTLIETIKAMEVFGWDYAEFPLSTEKCSGSAEATTIALFPATIPVNSIMSTESIIPGERIDLALYIEASGAEAFEKYNYVEITLGDAIALPEDIPDTFISYVIYCVFE